jgi:CRP-like cAMP-binding protein
MISELDPRLIQKGMLLRNSTFFNNLSNDLVLEIARLGEDIYLQKNEVLFYEGDTGDGIYFVMNGVLDVVMGNKTVNQINEGSVLGEIALLDSGLRSATIKAAQKSLLLRFSPELFDEILEDYPLIAKQVMITLVKHVRELTKHLDSTEQTVTE